LRRQQGWWDTQVNGNTAAPTPNIKKMMDAGMRLDRHYVFRYVSHFIAGSSQQPAASMQ
jgi:arylsulfatase A-like enzyme